MLSTLLNLAKRITSEKNLWLFKESFKVSVDFSIETESQRSSFHNYDDYFSISVFDKELNKSVSLDFWDDSLVSVFVHFWKQRRTAAFWKKPTLQIDKTKSYEISIEDEIDENINFIWDRIPGYLINLKD